MPEPNSKQQLRLYSANGEITTVRNPVRNDILNLLATEGEVPFSRIMELTGFSKSTVSGYLSSLVEAGLILEVGDPSDARRKNYVLNAEFIGDITPRHYSGASEFRELIRLMHLQSGKIDYREIMPHLIKIALHESGVHIDPVLRRGGIILGEAVAPFVVADDLGKTLENIAEFWKHYGFGDMKIANTDKVALDVYNCYECANMPKDVHSDCIISIGILTALLSAYYKKDVVVTETQCIAHGAECCRYEINA